METVVGQACPWAAGGQAEMVLGSFIQLLLASYCGIYNPKLWPKDRGEEIMKEKAQEYDFIVVGAGSAGSVVARRLAEEKWKVILLEAGDDPTPESEVPAMVHGTQMTPINWGFRSEKNPRYCQGMIDKQCHIPRGKALGGSSAINYMLYLRGTRQDYDEWENLGNPGWGYESVKGYFTKQEALSTSVKNYDRVSSDYGSDGLLNVESFQSYIPWKDVMEVAWKEKGYNINENVNEENIRGLAEAFGTVKGGQRYSSAKAYLTNLQEDVKNHLYVVRNAQVLNILMDKNKQKAVGVKVKVKGKEIKIKAKKEVILSAGVINTPQILMLSGIGPKEHLNSMRIKPIIADLPVGRNLIDHVLFPIIFQTEGKGSTFTKEMMVHSVTEYLLQRKGIFGTVGMTDFLGYIHTNDEVNSPADIQILHFYAPANDSFFVPNLISGMMYDRDYTKELLEASREHEMIIIFPSLLKPKSKGKIELKNRDPVEPPLIYIEHFSDEEDLEILLKAVRFVDKLDETDAFKKAGLKMRHTKLKDCPFEFKSDDYWKCLIRHIASTVYHQVGTAKMGPSVDDSVVDSRLRVHGVQSLRVIDASIMPNIIRGTTNGPTIMIGEKGADMIKEDWKATSKEEL